MEELDPKNRFNEVAIIGMSGRFPGAKNVDEFWQNLRNGIESVSFFSDRELGLSGVSPEIFNSPDYVKAKAVLDDIEMFDASFFGFTPREAEVMDPQYRLFLECCWEALENAGYNFEFHSERVGVYAGSGMSTYLLFNILSNPDIFESVGGLQVRLTNDKDFLTTHVSYKLNLQGPSVVVQTACSTSLVAVHLACQGLLDGECNMALAGGVTVGVPHRAGYTYRDGGIWSPDGHCRAFDARAQGTLPGNGAGVVVLKRLTDALAEGDYIYAIIKGSAINNDGSQKSSYTAPSVDSQMQVVTESLSMAGVSPTTITLVEAHGSATPIGDPIEVQSLTKAFRTSTDKKTFCALGSVKTNIGHLDAAAGIASLIKTVQALKHKSIPPSLHFEQGNPHIDLPNSPFYVSTALSEWKPGATARRAGVSSLGIGGTNAHIILEEAPLVSNDEKSQTWQLLVLSAKTRSALDTATANLSAHLRQQPDINLADVAYTLQVGRRGFNHRRALICRNVEEATTALESLDSKCVLTGSRESQDRSIAFMFPGLGDHYAGMAFDLYGTEPAFRHHVDHCAELLKPYLNRDLRDVIYPSESRKDEEAVPSTSTSFSFHRKPDLRKMLNRQERKSEDIAGLNQTYLAQPALFVIEYALANMLMEWGIQPSAMIGYSLGEYAAATLAGVFSIEDALFLVAERARMIQELPGGAMLAVALPEHEVLPLLDEKLSLCASNGAWLSVIGGPQEAAQTLEQKLAEQNVICRRLQTSHAFHSKMLDPMLDRFTKQVSKVRLRPPKIPFVSNVTGTWITDEEATDPSYWVRHTRQTIRFADGLNEIMSEPERILLEIGPGQALSTLAKQHLMSSARHIALPVLRDQHDTVSDVPFLQSVLAQLWLTGLRMDWQRISARRKRRRIPLPTYPFERQRYWIEPRTQMPDHSAQQTSPGKKEDIADWFYTPIWKRTPSLRLFDKPEDDGKKFQWLIFLDGQGLGSRMASMLLERGHTVVRLTAGESFAHSDDSSYTIDPWQQQDYAALIKALRNRGMMPDKIVHLWNVTPDSHLESNFTSYNPSSDLSFYSLLFLAQALGEQNITGPIHIGAVSNHVQEVTGEESICPTKATLWGPCKVIPQEYPDITCQSIDVVTPPDARQERKLADQLIDEMIFQSSDQAVAYRGFHRWVKDYKAVRLDHQPKLSSRLREGGIYLITGATDETGLLVSEYLAQNVRAKLALIASPDFPPKDRWERWLGSHDDEDEVSRKIRRVRAIEASGCDAQFLPADITNEDQMRAVIKLTRERFGAINGVIHAANVAGGGIIQLKTREMASATLAPKVKGTLVLASAIRDLDIDFLALFSSTVSIAGGFGQADNCAANAFLDAFAHQRSLSGDNSTVCINWNAFQWDIWQLPSTAATAGLQAQLQEHLQANGISSKEAMKAFTRILSSTLRQVVVCPQDIQAVVNNTDGLTAPNLLKELDKARPYEAHPRPDMAVSYVPPTGEAEQLIADTWRDAFGLEEVGIHDNFFDLGGNSLLALQIVTQLRKAFQIELPMTSLFEAPTVAGLARRIEGIEFEPTEHDDLDQILNEIEGLSLEEAEKRFAEEMKSNEQ